MRKWKFEGYIGLYADSHACRDGIMIIACIWIKKVEVDRQSQIGWDKDFPMYALILDHKSIYRRGTKQDIKFLAFTWFLKKPSVEGWAREDCWYCRASLFLLPESSWHKFANFDINSVILNQSVGFFYHWNGYVWLSSSPRIFRQDHVVAYCLSLRWHQK